VFKTHKKVDNKRENVIVRRLWQ